MNGTFYRDYILGIRTISVVLVFAAFCSADFGNDFSVASLSIFKYFRSVALFRRAASNVVGRSVW